MQMRVVGSDGCVWWTIVRLVDREGVASSLRTLPNFSLVARALSGY